jgi:hypothetical protein
MLLADKSCNTAAASPLLLYASGFLIRPKIIWKIGRCCGFPPMRHFPQPLASKTDERQLNSEQFYHPLEGWYIPTAGPAPTLSTAKGVNFLMFPALAGSLHSLSCHAAFIQQNRRRTDGHV